MCVGGEHHIFVGVFRLKEFPITHAHTRTAESLAVVQLGEGEGSHESGDREYVLGPREAVGGGGGRAKRLVDREREKSAS